MNDNFKNGDLFRFKTSIPLFHLTYNKNNEGKIPQIDLSIYKHATINECGLFIGRDKNTYFFELLVNDNTCYISGQYLNDLEKIV